MSRKKYVKNKDAENKIKMAAEYISQELCKQGCMIHRYDAYSTNSVYLKAVSYTHLEIRIAFLPRFTVMERLTIKSQPRK